jgi:prepilin-type N-terminal cleavage/methylation domain-containing protein
MISFNTEYIKKLNYRFSAFSLLEMSIVLVIVGIMAGGVMKGRHLLDSAKTSSVIQQFQHYVQVIDTYQQLYGYLPGDDPNAQEHFGSNVKNGSGKGLISSENQMLVWKHLYSAQLIDKSKIPSSKLGGQFYIHHDLDKKHPGPWLVLSNKSGKPSPTLTSKIAYQIMQKSGNESADEGWINASDGKGDSSSACIKNSSINRSEKKNNVCIVMANLN